MFRDIINYVKDDDFKVIFNRDRVLICSFSKVLVCDKDYILIKCNSFFVKIRGNNLVIRSMCFGEVSIFGKIKSVSMEDR